jgi:hypothetical protein
MKTTTIKEQSLIEIEYFAECILNYVNYRGITHIEELGKVKKLFRNILSGHKQRADLVYKTTLPDTKGKLPKWTLTYFFPDGVFRSFMSWKQRGRSVKKGQKCLMRDNEGIPLFEYSQTCKPDYVQSNARYYARSTPANYNTYYEDPSQLSPADQWDDDYDYSYDQEY